MKKNLIIAGSVISSLLIFALAVVFLQPPVDTLLAPYRDEPVLPYQEVDDLEKNLTPSGGALANLLVLDTVLLPDDTVISVGQVLTNRDIYAPALVRTNLAGGAVWTTILNPVDVDGVTYSHYGTTVNRIQKIIYVNETLIYAIGTIQASLVDVDGADHPVRGFFTDANIPIGLDQLNFVISFTDAFTEVTLHGFITPIDELNTQFTVIADATLLDETTMVLVGITNSHEGFFTGFSTEEPSEFVLKLSIGETLTLIDIFKFNHDTYVQPINVYGLANGDVIVLGQYDNPSGDFSKLPVSSTLAISGFIARIDGETFTLKWLSAHTLNQSLFIQSTMLIATLELTNHHVVTVTNVTLVNEAQTNAILMTRFDTLGKVVRQVKLNLSHDVDAIDLFKAASGYWVVGTINEGLNPNLILIKVTPSFNIDGTFEILGSAEDVWVTKPMVNAEGALVFFVSTSSKDEDYLVFAESTNLFNLVFITIDQPTA